MKNKAINFAGFIVVTALLLTSCSGISTTLSKAANQFNIARAASATATTASPSSASSAYPSSQSPSNAAQTTTTTTTASSDLLAAYENALESVYTTVSPQVVNIMVLSTANNNNFQVFPGLNNQPQSQTPQYSQALGSGFVWDSAGHIVTNNHVVDGSSKVEVTFSDGTTVPASVVGTDPYSDLAVLKVDVSPAVLHPVTMADSSLVKVGEIAIAIGNPYGFEGSMTVGNVSGLGRDLPTGASSQTNGLSYSIPDVIQTDASINPGNSGGVLVNDQGQVIGVTSAIESPVQANAGIGFAIPSALVQRVVPALIKNGSYEHPYLGISGTALTPDLAKAMNLKSDQRGALIEDITSGGPADKAGLHGSDRTVTIDGQDVGVGGDIIVAVNNTSVKTMDDLIAYLTDQTEVGQKVSLTVLRNGKEITLDVTLGARPTTTQNSNSTNQASVWLGIQGFEISPEIARAMNLPESQQGILVQQVENGSPADQAGLRGSSKPVTINGQSIQVGGDVITAIDGQDITTVDDLHAFLMQAQPGQIITLSILRGGKKVDLQLTLAQRPGQLP